MAAAFEVDLSTDDPAADYEQAWTKSIRWDNVVDVTKAPGKDWDERFAAAQRTVAEGVVYFPAGKYRFRDFLKLANGIVIRGRHPGPSRPPRTRGTGSARGSRWGRGTQWLVELCVEAGHPEPEFEKRAGEVVVRFLPAGYTPPMRVAPSWVTGIGGGPGRSGPSSTSLTRR